jgi:hypothetical protein
LRKCLVSDKLFGCRGTIFGSPKNLRLFAGRYTFLRKPTSNFVINSLTEEERAWLHDHPVIRVAQDPSWPPIEFTDERGMPSGMTSDYLKLIEQRLGLKFERLPNLSWQEAYARMKRWEIAMTTTVTATVERRTFWAFTKPYMTIPIEEALAMLQRGEVFACVDNMLVVNYYMAELKITNLKIAGNSSYNNAQCMAVRKS